MVFFNLTTDVGDLKIQFSIEICNNFSRRKIKKTLSYLKSKTVYIFDFFILAEPDQVCESSKALFRTE